MKAEPTVSVVIPCLNAARFLDDTIGSVIRQDYPHREIIVMDGGSTDGTVDIIRQHEAHIAHWVSEPDRGQSHAVNKGIRRSTGDIILWLNADDICLPGAFSAVGSMFKKIRHCRIVTGQARIADDIGRFVGELRSRFTSWEALVTRECSIRQVSTFFDRCLFDELGMLDENLRYGMDVDLLLRFTRRYPPVLTDDYLTAFRCHELNVFGTNMVSGYAEGDRIFLKHADQPVLARKFRRWSAQNWVALARNDYLGTAQRISCLIRATSIAPAILGKRRFWGAAKYQVLRLLSADNGPSGQQQWADWTRRS